MTKRSGRATPQPLTSWKDYGTRFDERLEDVVNNIIQHAGFSPHIETRLLPPKLSVKRAGPGVSAYYVRVPNQPTLILVVGGHMLDFIHQFTAATATYFLPTSPDGLRPSELWREARVAVAKSLEWISSPSQTPSFPDFRLTPRQALAAKTFGNYAFRFAICHELAHTALDHVGMGLTVPLGPSEEHSEVYLASQESELAADSFGLELQLRSLPDLTHMVPGLASGVYFIYVMRLLEARLMLLGDLVDLYRWNVRLTHPPTLHRVFELMSTANRLHGKQATEGLKKVHEDLSVMVGLIWNEANDQQERVSRRIAHLVQREEHRIGRTDNDRPVPQEKVPQSGEPSASTIRQLLQIFSESPISVLKALQAACTEMTSSGARRDAASLIAERLVPELPEQFQRFWILSPTERVDLILGS